MIKQVVVTDAFIEHDGRLYLNPSLQDYEKELLCKKQKYSDAEAFTPLSWVARQLDTCAATLLATCASDIPETSKQVWVASPYHVKLNRAQMRVMPESMLDWSGRDAELMRDLLNPLLADEGISLICVGDALLLCCDKHWDVSPPSFAELSGGFLPDRLPVGEDAGTWMRMMSEIQMLLHQYPVFSASGVQYHGLWFWGRSDHVEKVDVSSLPNIATQHVYLKSVLSLLNKEKDASLIVTAGEKLPLLLNRHIALPKRWLLLGGGKSVLLTSSVIAASLAKVRAQRWKGI